MTIDITPEAVGHLCKIHEGYEQHGTVATLSALSATLTASQAETAASYEVAAGKADTYIAMGWRGGELPEAIRALTPADSKAALDRMIADARATAYEKALDAASDYTQRVYGDDWKFLSNPIDRERILAAIQKGGE